MTRPAMDRPFGFPSPAEERLARYGLRIEGGWRHFDTGQEFFLIFDDRTQLPLAEFYPDRKSAVQAGAALVLRGGRQPLTPEPEKHDDQRKPPVSTR